MIRIEGAEYGTAAEIAKKLTEPGGHAVTETMVRHWAKRDGLESVTVRGRGRGTVRYPLLQAALIDAAKRAATRGRPRPLDTAAAPA